MKNIYTLFLLTLVSLNVIGQNYDETVEWIFNDKTEYEKHLKLYNDSIRAYMEDEESTSGRDWIAEGYELTTESYWKLRNPNNVFKWEMYGVDIYQLYTRSSARDTSSCQCGKKRDIILEFEFVGIFKRPTHFPVYEPIRMNYTQISTIGVDMIDGVTLIDVNPTVVDVPDAGIGEIIKEIWNDFSAAGYPTYDRESGTWVIIPDGYEDQYDPKVNEK